MSRQSSLAPIRILRRIPRRILRRTVIACACILGILVFPRLLPVPPPLELFEIPRSYAVYDSKDRLLRLTLTDDEAYRVFVPLEEIAPDMVAAVLLQEDRWFYFHPGINPVPILRSIAALVAGDARPPGASTISMQLARRLWRIDTRGFDGKLAQMAGALLLEWFYSKRTILEAYLALAPFGGNIEGVQAAAVIYFGRDALGLTLPEALTLAVLPKSPTRRGQIPAELSRARERLFAAWVSAQRPEDTELRDELNLPAVRRQPPFRAPHFTDFVLSRIRFEARSQAGFPAELRSGRIRTTLDLDVQGVVETQTRAYLEKRRSEGLRNAAVQIVDFTDGRLVAELGSADFFDPDIEGQVNGTRAKRSPGSTLKPFVYGLAFEQGRLHPESLVLDAPESFGAYQPDNIDRDFAGPLTARDALIRSRNIPAIRVARNLKKPGIYDFLVQGGVTGLRPESHYQLGIVLGGAELSMSELVRLYAALGNGGLALPVRFVRSPASPVFQQGVARRLLSEEAAFLILDILKGNPRPGAVYAGPGRRAPVYWKTGTSVAFRDAWAAGVFDRYAIAVWVGEFDGSPNPLFSGRDAAGPLLFRIVDALRAGAPGDIPAAALPPEGVERVPVCSVSGRLPGKFCPHSGPAWFIPGRSPTGRCEIHREILIDADTGLRMCAHGGTRRVRTEVYEMWPSAALRVFRAAGLPRREPPPFDSRCDLEERFAEAGLPPEIISPLARVSYYVRGADAVVLRATADAGVRKLFWFVDDTLVGDSAPEEAFAWNARPGRYLVRVIDDRGRSDTREVQIESRPRGR